MLRTAAALVGRFRNLLLVAVAVAAGVLAPEAGGYAEPLVTPLVIFLVYASLRGLRLEELDVGSYALLVGLALCISYVLLPAGGIRVADAFVSGGAILGFAIVLSVPTTAGSAIVWTRLSRGDVQLSTTISIVSLLVAPIATPIVLGHLVEYRATVPVTSVAVDLLTIVGGGILLAAVIPDGAVSTRTVDRGTTLAILLLIYAGVAGVESSGVSLPELAAIVAVSALLLAAGLALTLLLGRGLGLERTRVLPLFFASNLKNLGVALLIAISFAEALVVVVIITFYVVQQLAGAFIADSVA